MSLLVNAAVIFAIISILLLIIRLHQKYTNAKCTSKKQMDGKVAIVTGGTAGMGLEIAKNLARRGAKVIIACPFEQEGWHAHKTILEETGNANVIFKLLNLASINSVRDFAKDILKTEVRLDLLINNAGTATPRDFQTKDGMNFVMQVNFYGHFLLTILLLPLLKKTGQPSEPSRIINTTSLARYFGSVYIKNMNRSGYYLLPFFLYANSKFCTMLFSRELSNRLRSDHVVVNCVNPGVVGTGIWDKYGIFGKISSKLVYHICKTPWEGAQTALHVALDESAGAVSGKVFTNCSYKRSRAKPSAYAEKLAGELWKETVRLVKLTDEELNHSFSEK